MSEFTVESPDVRNDVQKSWGLHNGIVILASLGLVALSALLEVLQTTPLLGGVPVWGLNVISGMSFALLLAAGSVIGMLVATRMLQAHVGERGAKRLAVWGVALIALSVILQAVLVQTDASLQDAGRVLFFATYGVSNVAAASVAVGAAMVALAFVGRIRR